MEVNWNPLLCLRVNVHASLKVLAKYWDCCALHPKLLDEWYTYDRFLELFPSTNVSDLGMPIPVRGEIACQCLHTSVIPGGLGNSEFTTNAQIKEKLNYKANELKMGELLNVQQKDYNYLSKQLDREWVKMGRVAWEMHIQKVSSVSFAAPRYQI